MTGTESTPWQLTDEERGRAYLAIAQSAAALFLGSAGPLAGWALEYLFERRNLIFSRLGTPTQAFEANGRALSLSAVRTPSAVRQGTLSLQTDLTGPLRDLGLRNGDPVGVVLTGHTAGQARSRLVVPTRVGERVDLAVPQGTYSLAAFASRRDSLFAAPDPFQGVTTGRVDLGGRQTLSLPLSSRTPMERRLSGRTCRLCGRWVSGAAGMQHICLPVARVFHCDQCTATFVTQAALDRHVRGTQTPRRTCWSCGRAKSECECMVGRFKRFWNEF
jgi:hypothetical protein